MKFIVTCSHPRAGENINDVAFHQDGNVKRTAPIDESVATQFRGCKDFEVTEFDAGEAERIAVEAERQAKSAAKKAEADAAKKAAAEAKAQAEADARAAAEAKAAEEAKKQETGQTGTEQKSLV